MKALVYSEPKFFEVKEVPQPECKANQAVVKVMSCGICKTDVHIHNGEFISKFPLTPGHEFSGVIVELGAEVKGFKVGDRVACDNATACGECYYCKRNLPLYCENFHSLGCNAPGGFAEYVVVNGSKLFHISDSMSFDIAAFAEPTACAVHGMDSIDVHNGDTVLMFGSGPTGIILAQLLKYGGAGRVVVAARSEFKLQILKDLGIETVLMDGSSSGDHVKAITEMEPQGFDIVVDATGSPAVLQDCLRYLKKGGKLVVYGVCDEADRITVSPYDVFANEYKIIGSFAQVNCFDRALNAIERGIVKVDRLITDEFSLEDYDKALKNVMNGKSSLKVIIHPGKA